MDTKPCFICSRNEAPMSYANAICRRCDERATGIRGEPTWHSSGRLIDPTRPPFERVIHEGRRTLHVNVDLMADEGANPVFVEGLQCWRRYRFGGWVAMADPESHTTLDSFYGHHGLFDCKDIDCIALRRNTFDAGEGGTPWSVGK